MLPSEDQWVTYEEPPYVALWRNGELARRTERVLETLSNCTLCPRHCHSDRIAGKLGNCRTGRKAAVSSWFPHRGEEQCLTGRGGSGTIFFSECNLRCCFCQNFTLSWNGEGVPLRGEDLARAMLVLQAHGCHNINFVTPSHVVAQILEALLIAVPSGLRLPLVFNTSSYDSVDTLALLDGVIDIYLADLKFLDTAAATRYCENPDYPAIAESSIREMQRQVGYLTIGPDGLARRGVMIRHLVMPGLTNDSIAIMKWIASELGKDTYVNIMAQYRPAGHVSDRSYSEIARRISCQEYAETLTAARNAGLWRFDPECIAVIVT